MTSVHDSDPAPSPGEDEGGGQTSRAPTDDDNVVGAHAGIVI
jgi:hypothetical protein